MSYLSSNRVSAHYWVLALTGSAAFHALFLTAIIGHYAGAFSKITLPSSRPEFNITLDRLETDTLAGLLEQDGAAGATGEDEDGSGADEQSTETSEDDDLSAETIESVDAASETVDELTAEVPQAVTPETLDAQPIEGIQGESETAEGVAQNVDSLDAVTALDMAALEEVLPLQVPELLASQLPSERSPITPIGGDIISVQPVQGGIGTQTTSASPEVAPLSLTPNGAVSERLAANTVSNPTPTPPPTSAPKSEQDLAIGDLISRIRSANLSPCLLALPRRDGKDGVGIALFSATDSEMVGFGEKVLTKPDDSRFRQTRTLVDQRQCPALAFVRRSADYPATRLGIHVERPELPSGETLEGTIRGVTGRYVSLLLIDNNGVVQDLQRFMQFSGNFARFSVPVNRVGNLRDTKQMLIAVGTQAPHKELKDRSGQLAQDVFSNLSGELRGSMALAFTTFDVR